MSSILATGGYDEDINIWDVRAKGIQFYVQHLNRHVSSLAIGPQRKFLAAAGSESITVYDMSSKVRLPLRKYAVLEKPFNCVGFSEDNNWIFGGSEDNYAAIWDLKDERDRVRTSFPPSVPVSFVCLHPNQKDLYVATKSGDIFRWDLGGLKEHCLKYPFYQPLGRYVWMVYMDVDPKGEFLAAVNNQGKCFFFLLHDGYPQLVVKFTVHDLYISACKFSPNSLFLATTSHDSTTKLWLTKDIFGSRREAEEDLNLRDFKVVDPVLIFKNPTPDWVSDMAFSCDSDYIFTASGDKVARLWSMRTQQVIREYRGQKSQITSLAFWNEGTM